jgi:hypothetical protein
MPLICYKPRRFSRAVQELIDHANAIIEEYTGQGFILTLRQLYYQMVARGIIENKVTEYKRLGGIVNDARMAGLMDWDAIEDRTRNLQSLSHWNDPADIVAACADSFRVDKWATQKYRPEVWIEKEALAGVFERVCTELDVPFFCCRGYTSQSEMWGAGQRLQRYVRNGQTPIIFHFGDHDPSGIDMTRDVTDRLEIFMGGLEVKRLALNMSQVRQYNPPPNPAKDTDSRFAGYIELYGDESWELDALDPTALATLVRDAVRGIRNETLWRTATRREERDRTLLRAASRDWEEIAENLNTERE